MARNVPRQIAVSAFCSVSFIQLHALLRKRIRAYIVVLIMVKRSNKKKVKVNKIKVKKNSKIEIVHFIGGG